MYSQFLHYLVRALFSRILRVSRVLRTSRESSVVGFRIYSKIFHIFSKVSRTNSKTALNFSRHFTSLCTTLFIIFVKNLIFSEFLHNFKRFSKTAPKISLESAQFFLKFSRWFLTIWKISILKLTDLNISLNLKMY